MTGSDPHSKPLQLLRIVRLVRAAAGAVRRRARSRVVQINERLLKTAVGDATIYYPSSSIIGAAVAAGTGWEPTLATAFQVLVPEPAPVVAEVGANIGVSLAHMIAVRPDARFICFEPSRRFRAILVRNVLANGWDQVTVEDALVAAQRGRVRLFTNTSTASAASRDYGGHSFLGAEDVDATTIDAYFEQFDSLDFLKTDTDGFDGDVLFGASESLARFAPALYFEFAPFLLRRAHREPLDVLNLLCENGYRRFVILEQGGDPIGLSEDVAQVVRIAEDRGYIDIVTAAKPHQVDALRSLGERSASDHGVP